MATISELNSLETINYKSRIKIFLYGIIVFFLFIMAFFNFYPVGDKLKGILRSKMSGTACNPDFDQLRLEWLLPKIIVSNLSLPAGCFNRMGEPIKLSFLTINYNLINFSPFGIPFRIDTEIEGQPISLYYVLGFGQQMVRLKDQNLVLSRLQPLMGGDFKIAGSLMVDLNLVMGNDNKMKSLSFKAASKDFQIPSQSLQGFTIPHLKLNELYLEANSETPPRLDVDKLIIGDPDSPMRANFKGKINLQQGAISFSLLDLGGEVAFSESFKKTLPLIDMMFQQFTQKDGFYQVRLGGTLGAPKPFAP